VREEDQKNKYFPMMAGVEDVDFFSEKENLKWERKHALPQKTQNILTSNKIVDFIYGVEQRYHLQDSQTEEFSRTVRGYFFREITEGGFAQKISALCNISPDEALKLLRAINAIEPKIESEDNKNYIQLSLNDAINKYPQILKQIITGKNITTKPFLKPLKPTVKNWIMVYEKILDVSKHNTIERGEFVFRSQATKGLNEDERKMLLILFKSRDEDEKLTIDIDSGKIVFENITKQEVNSVQNAGIRPVHNISKQNNPTQIVSVPKKQKAQQSTINQQKNSRSRENDNVDTSTNPQLQKLQDINKQMVDEMNVVQDTDIHPVHNISKQSNNTNKELPVDVQEEILKNKKEMGKDSESIRDVEKDINDKKKPKKIGSAVFNSDVNKSTYKNKTQSEINKNKLTQGEELLKEKSQIKKQTRKQTRKQSSIGAPLQKDDLNREKLVEELKPKLVQEKVKQKKEKKKEKGKISFSSNHVMPVEKNKRKEKLQQQNTYNSFNMKPMGQTHIKNKEKDDTKVVEE